MLYECIWDWQYSNQVTPPLTKKYKYYTFSPHALIFEFDIAKSASDKEKHGIDFDDAQRLWSGGELIVLTAKAIEDEQRFAVIGLLWEKHWVVFYTHRADAIRLISVRRARTKEIEYYESI